MIDERIKMYGGRTRDDVTDFLVRSYQRYYRKKKLSPEQARNLMQKGIAHPGSLEAIVKNMKREFPKAPIRYYSFSKIFRCFPLSGQSAIERGHSSFVEGTAQRLAFGEPQKTITFFWTLQGQLGEIHVKA